MKDVFDHTGYKKYLKNVIAAQPAHGHGFRSEIAKATGCQISYVSQVLNKNAHFSLEQAEAINELLGHTDDESDFFLLLLLYERSGSTRLRKRIKTQMDQHLRKRQKLKDRVDIKTTLSQEHQAVYYSSWLYAAVHILTLIKTLQTKDALRAHLNLSMEKIGEVLEFLRSAGLVTIEHGIIKSVTSRIFLGNDSPMIVRHHTNWRLRAIDSLDKGLEKDVHLSTVVSLNGEDVLRIKEKIIKDIESTRAMVKESENETDVYCFNVDFFKV